MPTDPTYSPYLKFNPTFKWGGRSWGANDLDAFRQALARRGKSYDRWARNHRTAAKVFDPAEQQIYGLVQPQLDAINYERQKAEAFNQRRMHDLAGFTQAIMGMLGQIGPAAQGAYNQGANTMQSLGTGYGAVLNDAVASANAGGNSLLSVLGAPEGQQVATGDAGGVLAGIAGWLPAEMMRAQGKGVAQEFSGLPKEASVQAQLEMRQLMAETKEREADFANEISNVLKGIPSIRQEIAQARTAQRLDEQKLRLQRLEADRDYWLSQQALLLQQKKYKLAAKAEARAAATQDRINYETQGRDYEGNPRPGYTVNPNDPNGPLIPPDHHVDKNGQVVKNKSGSKKGSKWTPSQRAQMLENIDGKEEEIQDAVIDAIKKGEWTPGVKPVGPGGGRDSGKKPAERAKLARKLFAKYQHLAGTPTAKKRLRTLIGRILAEAEKSGGAGAKTGGFWEDV